MEAQKLTAVQCRRIGQNFAVGLLTWGVIAPLLGLWGVLAHDADVRGVAVVIALMSGYCAGMALIFWTLALVLRRSAAA